jgi:competence protein ComEC
VLATLALVGFVILVRPSPSVLRAAAMGAIGLLALATGRTRAAAAALAAAVAVALVIDPALASSVGFALSVLATGALILLAPRWRDGMRAAGVPPGVAEALAVPAAAQVACAPVIAALSGQVSLVAVPANLLAAPAVAPATVFGVGSAVVSPFWPEGARALAWLASWPARWLVWIAHTGSAVPVGSIPWAAGWAGAVLLVAVIGAVFIAARRPVLRRLLLVVALAAAVGAVPIRWAASGWPPEGAVVVVCDVGQGDAIVLPEGDGAAVVVDTGPDPVPVDGCLRRLGVTTITLLVITHFHVDHIGGLSGAIRGRRVSSVVLPTFDDPATGEAAVRAAAGAAAAPVAEVGVGWGYRHGAVELRVIGPSRVLTGTRSDPNNNSLLLLARMRGVTVLLIGDAEIEQQHVLLAEIGPDGLRADVLKVAHHGSSFQDPELLDAVHPRVALVSVGADNSYGHPSPPVLRRLADNGARVLRTDLDGDIAVVSTSDGLSVVVTDSRSASDTANFAAWLRPHQAGLADCYGRTTPTPAVITTCQPEPLDGRARGVVDCVRHTTSPPTRSSLD